MLRYTSANHLVTIHLHPSGKRVRMLCSCAPAQPVAPCAHVLEAICEDAESFEGADEEVDSLDALLRERSDAAEDIDTHQRDLATYLFDVADAENDLEDAKIEPVAFDRKEATQHARSVLREFSSYRREAERDLTRCARSVVRLALGCSRSGRTPAMGWEFAVAADTVKDIEDAYAELLRMDASQTAAARWKQHLTERASASQGCGSATLVLIAGLAACTWTAVSF